MNCIAITSWNYKEITMLTFILNWSVQNDGKHIRIYINIDICVLITEKKVSIIQFELVIYFLRSYKFIMLYFRPCVLLKFGYKIPLILVKYLFLYRLKISFLYTRLYLSRDMYYIGLYSNKDIMSQAHIETLNVVGMINITQPL